MTWASYTPTGGSSSRRSGLRLRTWPACPRDDLPRHHQFPAARRWSSVFRGAAAVWGSRVCGSAGWCAVSAPFVVAVAGGGVAGRPPRGGGRPEEDSASNGDPAVRPKYRIPVPADTVPGSRPGRVSDSSPRRTWGPLPGSPTTMSGPSSPSFPWSRLPIRSRTSSASRSAAADYRPRRPAACLSAAWEERAVHGGLIRWLAHGWKRRSYQAVGLGAGGR